jgi:hypothetical protein
MIFYRNGEEYYGSSVLALNCRLINQPANDAIWLCEDGDFASLDVGLPTGYKCSKSP